MQKFNDLDEGSVGQCGDDCKGECSGEVTGVSFCPHDKDAIDYLNNFSADVTQNFIKVSDLDITDQCVADHDRKIEIDLINEIGRQTIGRDKDHISVMLDAMRDCIENGGVYYE